uniref:Reverse transcriptase domain-containing protein n=1 Tax=Haemonchus contortus TaxID=6289 RepID=A0A7I5EDZ6_HAECO
MQVRKVKFNIIGLTETSRHRRRHAVFETGKEPSSEACHSRGVSCVDVAVNTHLVVNIDSSNNLRCLHANIELRGGRAVAFHIDLERLELIRQRGAARAVRSDQPRSRRSISKKSSTSKEEFDKVILPELLSAVPESIMRHVEWEGMRVKVDDRYFHHIGFADDIVFTTRNIEQLERRLTEFDNTCGKIGSLNLTKTILIRNGFLPDAAFTISEKNISE